MAKRTKKRKVPERVRTWGIAVRLPRSRAIQIKQVIAVDENNQAYSLEIVRVVPLPAG